VPFCRTNTPQTNLSYGCSNPIFGATRHPMDESRTPGGSSGGEAALMAVRGSILGLGTDIGGSVRVPAAFCGVCGFKPSGGRITKKGYFSVLAGQSGVTPAFGPMSPEVPAIAECMAALTSVENRPDKSVAPVPWNWGEYSGTHKLRVGYYVADGFIAATPACVQAVHQACSMLRARGHDVVPFRPPCVIEGLHLFIKLLTADGGKAVSDALQDEVIDDSLRAFVQAVQLSGSFWKGSLLPKLLRRKGKVRSANLLEAQGRCSTSDLWDAQAKRMALATTWEKAMTEAGVVGFSKGLPSSAGRVLTYFSEDMSGCAGVPSARYARPGAECRCVVGRHSLLHADFQRARLSCWHGAGCHCHRTGCPPPPPPIPGPPSTSTPSSTTGVCKTPKQITTPGG
jgi:fatty acid amide hydrolase